MNVDITRDHCEWRFTGNDRSYATSTMIFPNGSVARWTQNEVEFAGAMAAGWTRATRTCRFCRQGKDLVQHRAGWAHEECLSDYVRDYEEELV